MSRKKLRTPKAAKRASKPEQIDAAIAQAAAPYADTLPVRAVAMLGKLADQPPVFVSSLVTIGAGAITRRPALLRAGIRMLAAETVATGIKAAIKHYVARTRPAKMRKDGRYVLEPDKGEKDAGPWNSFPSGHTAGAVAVARAVTREFPAAGPAAGATAGLVGAVQVPKGAHFPSDVVAGAAIGFIAEAAADAAVRVARRRRWLPA